MADYKLWIGGKWLSPKSGKTSPTFNPTTGEEIAQIPLAGQEDVDLPITPSLTFQAWSQKMQMERSQIMQKIAAAIHTAPLRLPGWKF